ncbi:MAG: hypothetical protein M0C28_23785 [Candidatus Moduliflexus flocculans]|nr:hypothetical protein [Candidatus Moduliflexus flocculans]
MTVLMDYTVLTMHVLEEYSGPGLSTLLRLIALEALFAERELAAVRRTLYWELFERQEGPRGPGLGPAPPACCSPGIPMRRGPMPRTSSSSSTTRDVAAFYDRFYRPGNAAVLVSGTIDARHASGKARQPFRGLVRQPRPSRPPLARPVPERPGAGSASSRHRTPPTPRSSPATSSWTPTIRTSSLSLSSSRSWAGRPGAACS